MIKALRKPALFRLWLGQACSSVGDEIYRVGLTWFAVGLMGADTGYLAAGQTASLMLLCFVGGKWADHWHPLRTMIGVDISRALIVLIPVVVSFFIPVPMVVLWVVALSLSALSAFFEPATQSTIPILAEDTETMKATNGLMGTTIRMARMIGPAIVGLLAAFIPMIHFFSLDALTFLVSAISGYSLSSFMSWNFAPPVKAHRGFREAVLIGIRLIRKKPGMNYIFFSKMVTAGTWSLALMIGFPLMVHQMTNGNASAFGLVMASYGVGNFAGALYFGNRPRKNLLFLIFAGYVWLGLGFVMMGLAPNIAWLILAAAIGGFGGPINDLAFIDLMQREFAVYDLTKVFRLRMAVEAAGTLFFTLISPWLIRETSVHAMVVLCGVIWILVGFGGAFMPSSRESRAAGGMTPSLRG